MELFRHTDWLPSSLMPSRDRPDDATLDAWTAWLRAHRSLTSELDAELRDRSGMSLEDYDVLVQLATAEGGQLMMSHLADALLLARSSCTRIVGRLEDRGWVERTADDHDGRIVWAAVTTAGRRAQRRAAVVHLAGVQRQFGRHLRGRDAAVLRTVAERIVNG
jgi:DNA-binding MarR family transcriptional regulator